MGDRRGELATQTIIIFEGTLGSGSTLTILDTLIPELETEYHWYADRNNTGPVNVFDNTAANLGPLMDITGRNLSTNDIRNNKLCSITWNGTHFILQNPN
jgi:hypothetical protein